MKALVLTAGFATRFRPQSEILPKPAMPFLEVPLFLYGVELLKSFGVNDFIFNLHHLPQAMQKTIESYKQHMSTIEFVSEKPEILGSGGAIYNARALLEKEENFFLCNGDEIILPSNQESLKNFISLHKDRKSLATLYCMKHSEAGKKFGAIWVDDTMRVRHIGKTCDNKNLSPYHFTGVQILNKNIFNYLKPGESNIFYDSLLPAIQKGQRVQVFVDPCEWVETGNNQDYIDATKYFLENFSALKYNFLFKSMLKHMPVDLVKAIENNHHPLVYLGPGTQLAKNVQINGFLLAGSNCNIGAEANIKNAVLYANSKVKEKESLENTLVVR